MRPAVASSDSWNPTSQSTARRDQQHDERGQPQRRRGVRTRAPQPRDEHRAGHQRRADDRRARAGEHDVAADDGGGRDSAVVQRPPGRRSQGRAIAATSAATIAMFQPEMATTCVSPAVANASLISGAMDARTPSRIPAPRAASGSGTIAFSPSSSARAARRPGSQPGPVAASTSSALRGPPDRSDALPRQVLAVREAVEVLGQLDARRVPAGDPRCGRRCHAASRPAVDRPAPLAWPSTAVIRSPRTSWIRSSRGRGSSTTAADELVFLAVDEAGDRAQVRCSRRISARMAPGANGGECDDDTDQKQAARQAATSGRSACPRPAAPTAVASSSASEGVMARSADRIPAAAPANASGRANRPMPTVSRRWRRPGCPPAGLG